jgi:GntR family transcriptional repressor for pyruvate dehydrogenase complex
MALASRLEPAPRLSEVVAERVLALIRSGELAEGSRLPPERELAETLGVSRTIVREGLSALQLAGLIERRRGAGTVVKRIIGGPSLAVVRDQIHAGASIVELLDARLAVELGIAHLLVEQGERDFAEVEALLAEMVAAVRGRGSVDAYIEPSFDFHLALARVSAQPLLVSFVEGIYEQMRPHVWLIGKSYTLEVAERSLALHEQILEGIRGRDVIGALAAIQRHYRKYPALQTRESSARGAAARPAARESRRARR